MLQAIAILGGWLLMMGQHDRSESLFYYFRIEDHLKTTCYVSSTATSASILCVRSCVHPTAKRGDRERRVMGNLLLEPQPGEPAPRQVHAQFFQQLPLTGDAVEIPQQQDPQQHFRINRRFGDRLAEKSFISNFQNCLERSRQVRSVMTQHCRLHTDL